MMSMINVNYSLLPEARKFFAKATGSISLPGGAPGSQLPFIPQKGDCLRWDAISTTVVFVVENRLIRFGPNGDVDVDLFIEIFP